MPPDRKRKPDLVDEALPADTVPPAKKMTRAQVAGFIEALANSNPAPETELAFTDALTLLVAVVLSAQATDVSVNKATKTLFAVAPTPEAMVALGDVVAPVPVCLGAVLVGRVGENNIV